jgi:hypothetical protein
LKNNQILGVRTKIAQIIITWPSFIDACDAWAVLKFGSENQTRER